MNTDTDSFQTSKEALSAPKSNDSEETKSIEQELVIMELELANVKLASIKQKVEFGKWVAIIAIITPLIILGMLLYQLMASDSVFCKMQAIPQAILISASFLSFIVIYTMLIKGMFEQKKEESQSLTKAAMDNVVREIRKSASLE